LTWAAVTDVRNKSDLTDYTGELQADQRLRVTDSGNGPSEDEAGTTADIQSQSPCRAPRQPIRPSARASPTGYLCVRPTIPPTSI